MKASSHQPYEAGASTTASPPNTPPTLRPFGSELPELQAKRGLKLGTTQEAADDNLGVRCRIFSVSPALCTIRNKKRALTLLCASKSSN